MKYLFIAFLILSGLGLKAESDSTAVKKHKKELSPEERANRDSIDKKFDKFSKDRIAIDLNASNWIINGNDPRFNGMRPKWYSRGINLYFYYDFRIKHSRFSFAAGVGYSVSNINYDAYKLAKDTAGGVYFQNYNDPALHDSSTHKIDKLALQYFDIPLEFRIKTNPDKLDQVWKFAIGLKAGVRVDAHTKDRVVETDGSKKVSVERLYPDINLFRFGPTLRIGYSFFNLTAYYGVIDVFKKDRGPKANEFTVGISFNGL